MVAYLLFYSNRCKYSRNFIKKLENCPQLNFNFKKICVDKNSLGIVRNEVKQAIKSYKLKGVPSIVVNNNVLLGSDAEYWLDNQLMNNDKGMTIHSSLNKKDYSEFIRVPDYNKVQSMEQNDNGPIPMSGSSQFIPMQDAEFTGQMFGNNQQNMSLDGMSNSAMQQTEPPRDLPPQLLPIKCNVKHEVSQDQLLQEYQMGRTNDFSNSHY